MVLDSANIYRMLKNDMSGKKLSLLIVTLKIT